MDPGSPGPNQQRSS